jgi:hypothetical protein
VTVWNTEAGPLRNTSSGLPLPLPDIAVFRRWKLAAPDESTDAWFSDSSPFLVRIPHERGLVVFCATLPDGRSSSLGYDVVLLPLVQRLLDRGSERFGTATSEPCARRSGTDQIVPVYASGGAGGEDPGLVTAVVRRDGELLALRRPLEEDTTESIDVETIQQLLEGAAVSELQGGARPGSGGQRELWSALATAALLFMLCESALTAHSPESDA